MSISSPLSLSTPPPLMYCYQSGKTKINQNLQIMTAPASQNVTKIQASFCRKKGCPLVFLDRLEQIQCEFQHSRSKLFYHCFMHKIRAGKHWDKTQLIKPDLRTWLCCIVVPAVAPTYQILKYWISIERQKSVF